MTDALSSVPRGRGHFNHVALTDHGLSIGGWLILPTTGMDCYEGRLDGAVVGTMEAVPSAALAADFSFLDPENLTGFSASFSCPRERLTGRRSFCVLGVKDQQPIARMELIGDLGVADRIALPPEHLRVRVCNNPGEDYYRTSALKSAGELLEVAEECGIASTTRILDWGCGCGRTVSTLLEYMPDLDVYGCDVDGEAISWCSNNLPGDYRRINVLPPTNYEDESFGVVVGYSVCTHLSRSAQLAWLEELRRITRPGAFLFLSVHGEFAVSFQAPTSPVHSELARHGISDSTIDTNLEGVVDRGSYLGTFQTQAYTGSTWSKVFDILDYREAAISNFQDLVILRRR